MFTLRELCRDDMPEINKWRNNQELISFLGAPFRFIDQAVDEKWYIDYLSNRNNTIRCAIIDQQEPEKILGLVSLTAIDWISRSCEFHIMIGKEQDRGKGIGSYALKAILEHAFNNMNLDRVELAVLSYNTRAISLYKKQGFVVEGCMRSAVYKNGKYEDMIMMSLLDNEWKDLKIND